MTILYFIFTGIIILLAIDAQYKEASQQRKIRSGTHTYNRMHDRIVTIEQRKKEDEEFNSKNKES